MKIKLLSIALISATLFFSCSKDDDDNDNDNINDVTTGPSEGGKHAGTGGEKMQKHAGTGGKKMQRMAVRTNNVLLLELLLCFLFLK